MSNLGPTDTFVRRHVGPSDDEIREMLETLGLSSLDELTDATVPEAIRLRRPLRLGPPRGEHELLAELKTIASRNAVVRSFIGMGYYDTITPPVIQRNILENPGWYTQYTPYQAEIAQGRLEALLNFQTMVSDLTALPLANASMLDEATAAAEAMAMCRSLVLERDEGTRAVFFVAEDCHPQTIAVVRTRAKSLAIELVVGGVGNFKSQISDFKEGAKLVGVLLQYPTTDGRIVDYSDVIRAAHDVGALVVMAADILALTLIKPPGELGADIAVGSTQRFGVPMGFGGPHAAYMATKQEFARKMPGRIIGVSKDVHGRPALRLALQTREQHIRREKATSNICTAQVLLAIMAGLYAVYHGPCGLKAIAQRVKRLAEAAAGGIRSLGHVITSRETFFDTFRVRLTSASPGQILARAHRAGINLRVYEDENGPLGISLDETTTPQDVADLINVFDHSGRSELTAIDVESLAREHHREFSGPYAR